MDKEVRQPEPQPDVDPNAEALVDTDNEWQPSSQSPDDGAAANIAGKEAANNEQRRNASTIARINRNESNANILTPALTILAQWNFPHTSIIEIITVLYFTQ